MDCRCRGAIRHKKKTSRQALPDSALMVVTFYDVSSATIHSMLDRVLIRRGIKIYHHPNIAPECLSRDDENIGSIRGPGQCAGELGGAARRPAPHNRKFKCANHGTCEDLLPRLGGYYYLHGCTRA